MKFSTSFLIAFAAVSGAHGFTSMSPIPSKMSLSMADAVAEPEVAEAEEVVQEEAPAPAPVPLSGLSIAGVRKSISNLDASNFGATLSEIEPFLLNEAGATVYAKSMRRIAVKANALGVEMPADYAKLAKATEKKRAKQDAFIAQKEEERLAAEAEAADAEPAEEEEAPAEE